MAVVQIITISRWLNGDSPNGTSIRKWHKFVAVKNSTWNARNLKPFTVCRSRYNIMYFSWSWRHNARVRALCVDNNFSTSKLIFSWWSDTNNFIKKWNYNRETLSFGDGNLTWAAFTTQIEMPELFMHSVYIIKCARFMTICFVLSFFVLFTRARSRSHKINADFREMWTEVVLHFNQHHFAIPYLRTAFIFVFVVILFGVSRNIPILQLSKINMLFKWEFVIKVIFFRNFFFSSSHSCSCLILSVTIKKTINMHDYRLAHKHISILVGSTKG